MLDIGKLILGLPTGVKGISFSSMLDIGKLIRSICVISSKQCFSSMLDIGKLILRGFIRENFKVLAQCWI